MKKVISTGIVLMTVLMGCSFTKPTKDATSIAQQKDLAASIKEDSPHEIKRLLDKYSEEDLNALTYKGETLFDIALNRGSLDVVRLLLDRHLSPFKPNSMGLSLYLKLSSASPFDTSTTNTLLTDLLSQSRKTTVEIMSTDDWSTLPDKIQAYSLPCDQVITRMLIAKDIKMSLATLLEKAPSCKYSLPESTMRTTYRKLLNRMFASNFSNFTDLKYLYSAISTSLRYIQIKDYEGGIYMIHTEVIIKTLRNLNPVKADELLTQLNRHQNPNDAAISFSWKDPQNGKKLRSKIIQRLNETLDSTTEAQITKLIMDEFSPEEQP